MEPGRPDRTSNRVMLRRTAVGVVIITVAAVALVLEWPRGNEPVTDLTATGGGERARAATAAAAGVDTSADPLRPEQTYCGDRTVEDVVAEAGRITETRQPESESAWIIDLDGLAVLDPELADQWRTAAANRPTEEVFVIPVAAGGAERIEPRREVVAVDERRGHTAAVVLDCFGASAMRVFPPGFFPFGEPEEFLDPADWFSDWTGPDGRPATRDVINENRFTADFHCSWPDVAILSLNGQQYVSDPRAVFAEYPEFETTLDLDAQLPVGADQTGYRKGEVTLFLSPPEEPKAAYLVYPTRVERWPAPAQMIACA